MNHSQDHFSLIAGTYNEGRIRYPLELYEYLSELTEKTDIAWDCATGSGQAAFDLSNYFSRVIATDLSHSMLSYAVDKVNIEFRTAPAEASGIASGCIDLVIVAQAIHWFELDEFWQEVDRVLKHNGIFACWGYVWPEVDAEINSLLEKFKVLISTYWPEKSQILQNYYREVDAPFKLVRSPTFTITESWSYMHYLKHLSSWSGTRYHREVTNIDLVAEMKEDFVSAWGDKKRIVQWPLILKVYQKQ